MENRNQEQTQNHKPAKTSSKANGGKRTAKRTRWSKDRRDTMQQQALMNAVSQNSVANFPAIFEGFEAMGIALEDIRPRENVFTFNAWKAVGRSVRKGQHGVAIVTVIPCKKLDKATGIEVDVNKVKRTTVFHVSQTEVTAERTSPEASA